MTRRARLYPPLPAEIGGLAGGIDVIVGKLKAGHFGLWEPEDRRITINQRLRRGDVQWHTFLHELAHAALGDGSIELQTKPELVEPTVETVASQMLRVVNYLVDYYEAQLRALRDALDANTLAEIEAALLSETDE